MYSAPTNENKNFPFKLSYRDKIAKDYELARQVAEYYNSYYDEDKSARYRENFELHRGSWSQIENMSPTTNLLFESENIILGGGVLRHVPVINQVSQSYVTDLIVSPLQPVLRDTSSRAINHRERVRGERVRSYFQEKFVLPEINRIKAQFLSNSQQLSPEQMQEIQTTVQQQVIDSLPEEIADGLDAYKMPDEILGEKILNRILLDEDVKEKIDAGADYAVAVAEEYYHAGIRNNKPFLKLLNGKNVTWGGSSEVEWVQDAEFAKYTRYISFPELVADFGTKIKWNKIDDIIDLYSPIPNSQKRNNEPDLYETDITDAISNNPSYNDPKSPNYIDPLTRDGQQKLMGLYQKLGQLRDKDYGIKHTFITWRWTRKVKKVTRLINNKEVDFIEDEHYAKNVKSGDIKVEWILIEQVWSCDIINDEYYVNIGPEPYQYSNLTDLRKPPLPIIGLKYNTFHNNAKNASVIDLGKPANFKLNLVHKKLEEYEATDYGRMLFMLPSLKPDGTTWTQFLTSAFRNKVAVINRKFEGASNNDRVPFETIDMSRDHDIQSMIAKAEFYERQVVKNMLYNPAKFGQISQYSTNQNAALSVQGADRQVGRFMNKRRLLKQKLLTQLLNLGIIAFQENDYLKDLLFDDLTRAYFDLNVEPFSASSLGLYVVDDFEDSENVKQMKSFGLTFLQNGGSPTDISAIISAKSMSEIQDILEKSTKRMQEQVQKQQMHEQELAKINAKTQEDALKFKMSFEAEQKERDRMIKLEMARLNSEVLANANDIDENKVGDSLQKTILEIASNEKIEKEKRQIDRLKIARS